MNPKHLQEAERLCEKLTTVQRRIFQLDCAINGIRSVEIYVGGSSETFYCAKSEKSLSEAGQFSTFELIDDEDGALKSFILIRLRKCERAIKEKLVSFGCGIPPPWPKERDGNAKSGD